MPNNLCDCELSHNGLGIVGRECDCPASNKPQCDNANARLLDAAENLIIAIGMNWDLEGVKEVLRVELAKN